MRLKQQYALWKWLSVLVRIISPRLMLKGTGLKILVKVIQCTGKLYLNNNLETTEDEVQSYPP